MANSGSFNTTGYEGRYLTFSWALQSQSAANNQSVISWQLKGAGSASSSWYRAGNFKVVINGTIVYQSATRIQLYNGTIVSSGTITITHNANGTKTFTASAEAGIYTTAVNCRGSGSFELPTINRYATLTTANNFTDEQNPVCTFSNPQGAKLQLKIEAGDNTAVVVREENNPASPYTFVLTDSERNTLRALSPNSNTLNVRYTVGTFSGSSIVNYSTLDRVMNIVNAAPNISGVTYEDTNETTTALTQNDQIIVQNKSTLVFNIGSVSSVKAATLASAAVTINSVTKSVTLSGSSGTNINVNFGALNVTSDINANVVLTDSRGNTKAVTVPVTVAAWQPPTALITCARKNNFYSETDITVNASYSPVNGRNAVYINYQTKKVTAATWGALTPLQDDTTETITLDNNFAWNIRVIVSDLLQGSTTYNLTVDRGVPIVFFDKNKRSVGFNCFPQNENSVESNGVVLDDNIYIGSQCLYDQYTVNTETTTAILGAYGYKLISGLFDGVDIPAGYERGYRLTAQITTNGDNFAGVKLNNISSSTANTWSNPTMRALVATRIFKETEITLEPTYIYTQQNGTNLYVVNTTPNGTAIFYNITVHGYLIKSAAGS